MPLFILAQNGQFGNAYIYFKLFIWPPLNIISQTFIIWIFRTRLKWRQKQISDAYKYRGA